MVQLYGLCMYINNNQILMLSLVRSTQSCKIRRFFPDFLVPLEIPPELGLDETDVVLGLLNRHDNMIRGCISNR